MMFGHARVLELNRRRVCRRLTREAVARGELTVSGCEVCGAASEAHHHDYSDPLAVTWLCPKHHRERHLQSPVMSVMEGAHAIVRAVESAMEPTSTEILLTLKEFSFLFEKNYSAMRRKARRGEWSEAKFICGEWWVRVDRRDAEAARNRAA